MRRHRNRFAALLGLLALAAPATIFAQLPAPNTAGVSMGHVHLTVPDVAAHEKIWVALGAEPQAGRAGVLRLPGIYVLLAQGEPAAPSSQTSLNHVGFGIRDYALYKAKLEAAGATFFFDSAENGQMIADLPGGVRVELMTVEGQSEPIAFHHVHLVGDDLARLQEWYANVLGAERGERRGLPSAIVPGGRVDIMGARGDRPRGSRGAAIDHIGFEVADMDAFAARIAELGIELDAPPRRVDSAGLTIAFLTDPAGTYVEITEGLAELAGQPPDFAPVTQATLENPSPDDWLMFSRTYDAQRFSPLDQIDTGNVARLKLAWTKTLGEGVTETVPLVYDGTLYLVTPGAAVQALDAATGEPIWTYERDVSDSVARTARSKSLALFADVVVYTAPDSYVVGLDARTGAVRWETKAGTRGHTSGPIVVAGLAVSGGACFGKRDDCFIAAHDVLTGKEVWRFQTTPAPGEPGDESWAGAALENRQASTWGLPGSYDPGRNLLYWGIANPMPDYRAARHGGRPDAVARAAPADLYSNSTVALDPRTGKLVWYYQHLPADDWDLDATHERTLVRTPLAPDPKFVKWINPRIERGELRDVAVTITEGGGLFVLDRQTGEFLWATPFPFDTPEFGISRIDPDSGVAHINWDLVFKEHGERKTLCYWNTRSYWPTAYHPGTNSLYTSYIDACREITGPTADGAGSWRVVPRPGGDPSALTGLAKIDLSTGEVLRFGVGRAPGNGAVLTTAGGLVFHGDISQRFRAFDARTGRELWETPLGGNVSVSTITYAVDGKQYVAVMTGYNLKVGELMGLVPELDPPPSHNAIYAFALP